MTETISLNHGGGGRQTHELIKDLFVSEFGITEPLTDSAVLEGKDGSLVFTTDSYVVDPLFFPGGNIGKMSICGTVNDLSVSGAKPRSLAVSFIIEEGFPVNDLRKIVESMAEEALNAGVAIVTGDTKVVGKGKCDGLFITTSGVGTLENIYKHISIGSKIKQGDKLIVSGSLGNHAIAVLGVRKNLSFSTPVFSDCASLNHLIGKILKEDNILFMRDLTRGGLGAVLNELAEMTGRGISIDEKSVPVDDPVKGVCETLGFDPLFLANEGKILIVAARGTEEEIIDILHTDPLGRNSSVIGEVAEETDNKVILNTASGGRRIIDMPSGIQLPRIC